MPADYAQPQPLNDGGHVGVTDALTHFTRLRPRGRQVKRKPSAWILLLTVFTLRGVQSWATTQLNAFQAAYTTYCQSNGDGPQRRPSFHFGSRSLRRPWQFRRLASRL
jgi:hypothetical protein